MTSATVVTSLLLFLLAGLCEIGGGWLVWQWIREGRPWSWGLLGGLGALSLWCGPYAATCSLRSRLCSLRRFFIVLSLCGAVWLIGTFPTVLILSELL